MSEFRSISELEHQLLSEIDKHRLMEFNRKIAEEVRLSGSEEELRSFYYVKQKMEEFGLETELMFCDAYISLPGHASLVVGDTDYSCITHSMGGGYGSSIGSDCLRGSWYIGGIGQHS